MRPFTAPFLSKILWQRSLNQSIKAHLIPPKSSIPFKRDRLISSRATLPFITRKVLVSMYPLKPNRKRSSWKAPGALTKLAKIASTSGAAKIESAKCPRGRSAATRLSEGVGALRLWIKEGSRKEARGAAVSCQPHEVAWASLKRWQH